MYYTGFADEAAKDIDGQIKATLELGWENIESRNIDGINIHDLSEEKFEEVFEALQKSGVKINCFGSTVANWKKQPDSDEDFEKSIAELKRAITRMNKLGCKMIRGMSFAAHKQIKPDSPELEKMIFKKVQYLADLCADAGILYLHENCMNYGGMSWRHTLKLLDNIKSPAFKLLFDTGNPVFTRNRAAGEPYPYQSAWEFYRNVRDFVVYIHIKDCIMDIPQNEGGEEVTRFTFAGDGCGDVRPILQDMFKRGYDGGISIEPHIGLVFHEQNQALPEDTVRYRNYIEYGQRLELLINQLKSTTLI